MTSWILLGLLLITAAYNVLLVRRTLRQERELDAYDRMSQNHIRFLAEMTDELHRLKDKAEAKNKLNDALRHENERLRASNSALGRL